MIKKDFFSKLVVPLFIAIGGGIITYFAQEYFDKEKIEIMDVSMRAKKVKVTVPHDLATNLFSSFGQSIASIQGSTGIDYDAVLTSDKIYSYLKVYLYNKDKRAALIKEFNEKKNELRKLDSAELSYSYQEMTFDEAKVSQSDMIKRLNATYDNRLKSYKKTAGYQDSLVKILIPLIKKQVDVDRNNFFLEVIVENKGNKQGILKYKASLQIGKTLVNLDKSTQPLSKTDISTGELLSNYITVNPHSFNGLGLDIDAYYNKPGDIELAKKEFAVGQKSATLLLYGVNDEIVAQYNLICRDDLSRNENAELIRLINDNFSD